MSASQDFVALDWIKTEIAQTLEQAQHALEATFEEKTDSGNMRSCLTALHQVHGTLKMVEVSGPTTIAFEMESLAQSLLNGEIKAVTEAQEVLMQAILQLPQYLERIQREQKDNPALVASLVNNLQIARGVREPAAAEAKTEAVLDASLVNIIVSAKTRENYLSRSGPLQANKLWRKYHKSLVAVTKKQAPRDNLIIMAKVGLMAVKLTGQSSVGHYAQMITALTEGVATGAIKLNSESLKQFKAFNTLLKNLAKGDDLRLETKLPEKLLQACYRCLLSATKETAKIAGAVALFAQQADFVKSDTEQADEIGPDDETLAAVSSILIEELTEITDKLDLFVRSSDSSALELQQLVPLMAQVSSTLSVVGMRQHQLSIEHQIATIKSFDAENTDVSEEALLAIASALVKIQTELGKLAGHRADDTSLSRFGDLDDAQAAVIKETRSGLVQCKDAVTEYIANQFDIGRLEAVPSILMSLRGGLSIVNQDRSAKVLHASSIYINKRLLKSEATPSQAELNDLADAITSVDYFLEHLLENSKEPYLKMMEVAEAAIGRLGYDTNNLVSEEYQNTLSQTVAQAVEEPIADEDEPEVEDSGVGSSNSIDAEILAIFVEESQQASEVISKNLPLWPKGDSIVETRRAFHTLKGSGRMVGATAIAELSWAIEELLNKLIAGVVFESFELLGLLADVSRQLPFLIVDFEAGRDSDVLTFVERSAVIKSELDSIEAESLDAIAVESDLIETDEVGLEAVADFELDDLENRASENSELDLIFIEEVKQKLAIIDEFLAEPKYLEKKLTVAYHTLRGSAATAEVPSIVELATPMEALCSKYLAERLPVNNELISLIQLSRKVLAEIVGNLTSLRDSVDVLALFSSRQVALTDNLRSQHAKKQFEFDQIKVLGLETLDLDSWEQSLLAEIENELRETTVQAEAMNQVALQQLTTLMSEIYSDVSREFTTEKPPASIFDLVQEAHLALLGAFDSLASNVEVGIDETLISKLKALDVKAISEAVVLKKFVHDMTESLDLWSDAQGEMAENDASQHFDLSLGKISSFVMQLEYRAEQFSQVAMASLLEVVMQLVERLIAAAKLPEPRDLDLLKQAKTALFQQLEELRDDREVSLHLDLLSDFYSRVALAEEERTSAESETDLTDEIDLEVLPLFLEEAQELTELLDESIVKWQAGLHLETQDEPELLLRHLHTFKGGARLAGLNRLAEQVHQYESYLSGLEHEPVEFNELFFQALRQRQNDIEESIKYYQNFISGALDHGTPVSTQVEAVSKNGDGLDLAELDEEILGIFVEEAQELSELIEESILAWSGDTSDAGYLDNLLRHLHTLKGGARLAGLVKLGEHSHQFETELIKLQRQSTIDYSSEFFAGLEIRHDEILAQISELRSFLDEPEAHAMPSQSVNVDQVSSSEATDLVESVVVQPKASVVQSVGQPSQDMVKIDAALIESLIGLAGESNIARGRVEQQISDFVESLSDMDDTIVKIREQVRRLEIEATSRDAIFSNRSHSKDADSSFDELEMDRYTKLQEISRSLNEASSDMLDLNDTLVERRREAEVLLHQQARIGSELQEGLNRTRMVPFARLIPRLRRIVRQISGELGKTVQFDAFNIEGELDRSVMERIVAPLEHMFRNALDHGIESTEKRRTLAKPDTGRISLRLSREGGYLVIKISDDGRGIDVEAVRKKAIERGLMNSDDQLSDHDLQQFILKAGFSTAEKLTQISGRGVGLDVVTTELKQLGGSVAIASTLGVGTEFSIKIPFTVSINRALMVMVGDETYAVPLNTIEGIVRVSPYELEAYYEPDAPLFEYAGQPYELHYMGKFLEMPDKPMLEGKTSLLPVILGRSGDRSVAFQVDKVIGSREVVVKSLGPQFSAVEGISGATVLGDGSVVIILDVMALEAVEAEFIESQVTNESTPKIPQVMIVDDSVTVRKVTSRLVERQGWQTITAKDGLDAVNQLQDVIPDIMLLDIEMPRMDGFEVLRSLRNNEKFKNLPIVMITSRTGEKHQKQAFDLGVDRFLGKPFQEANLIATIEELLADD